MSPWLWEPGNYWKECLDYTNVTVDFFCCVLKVLEGSRACKILSWGDLCILVCICVCVVMCVLAQTVLTDSLGFDHSGTYGICSLQSPWQLCVSVVKCSLQGNTSKVGGVKQGLAAFNLKAIETNNLWI